ncbi:MAG: 30S ribosomal protein S2 [Bacteroidetes bacterium]|nr:30S ribosomal protein S2 [Bacteroidota bacterium]PHX91668.1 MAG: 30S ribosomal protein S2 [Flavobacteriales bacterium]
MAYTQQDLLESGVHFGHLTRKWNPKMAPYIFMEQNGIHIIDLKKTASKLEEAKAAAKSIAHSGRRILFVATKKQAKEIVAEEAKRANMPFSAQRWLGGMLTNFQTVRKSIKRMQDIDKMATNGTFDRINKKERLMLDREKIKLQMILGGIEDMNKLPGAIFIIDVKREHIAVSEATRLGIPTIALCDTNSDPTVVDYAIPGNDDASKAIYLIVREIADAIIEGTAQRKREKSEDDAATAAVSASAEKEAVVA